MDGIEAHRNRDGINGHGDIDEDNGYRDGDGDGELYLILCEECFCVVGEDWRLRRWS